MNILLAWLGMTDVRASQGDATAGLGPIGQVVKVKEYDEIFLLSNLEKSTEAGYKQWLESITKVRLTIKHVKLTSPTEFGEIYQAATKIIEEQASRHEGEANLTFHLSPGTPAMAAVWIIISKTRFPALLIESSKERGVKNVSIPFDISAEFLPNILRKAEAELGKITEEFSASAATFENIIYQSQEMESLVMLAQRVALFDAPVLIEGESGTGKELFAKAIHQASIRSDQTFVAVNCGAIPSELVESELFGHEKGSFTGATNKKIGKFVQAQKGSIFLDEVGELPLQTQVKLLRVIQEKEVTPVGAAKSELLDVRIISATNRTLIDEIAMGQFREDLFYRLAVFPLNIPPLRNRQGDLSLLIKYFLDELNMENTGKFWKNDKTLNPKARNILLNHSWPGNVRELQATILRAAIYSRTSTIVESDVNQAVFSHGRNETMPGSAFRPLVDGFNLQDNLAQTAHYYLTEALKQTRGNKSRAAKLLGLKSYQSFLNWWRKYVGPDASQI